MSGMSNPLAHNIETTLRLIEATLSSKLRSYEKETVLSLHRFVLSQPFKGGHRDVTRVALKKFEALKPMIDRTNIVLNPDSGLVSNWHMKGDAVIQSRFSGPHLGFSQAQFEWFALPSARNPWRQGTSETISPIQSRRRDHLSPKLSKDLTSMQREAAISLHHFLHTLPLIQGHRRLLRSDIIADFAQKLYVEDENDGHCDIFDRITGTISDKCTLVRRLHTAADAAQGVVDGVNADDLDLTPEEWAFLVIPNTAHNPWAASEICPDLTVMPYNPNLNTWAVITRKFSPTLTNNQRQAAIMVHEAIMAHPLVDGLRHVSRSSLKGLSQQARDRNQNSNACWPFTSSGTLHPRTGLVRRLHKTTDTSVDSDIAATDIGLSQAQFTFLAVSGTHSPWLIPTKAQQKRMNRLRMSARRGIAEAGSSADAEKCSVENVTSTESAAASPDPERLEPEDERVTGPDQSSQPCAATDQEARETSKEKSCEPMDTQHEGKASEDRSTEPTGAADVEKQRISEKKAGKLPIPRRADKTAGKTPQRELPTSLDFAAVVADAKLQVKDLGQDSRAIAAADVVDVQDANNESRGTKSLQLKDATSGHTAAVSPLLTRRPRRRSLGELLVEELEKDSSEEEDVDHSPAANDSMSWSPTAPAPKRRMSWSPSSPGLNSKMAWSPSSPGPNSKMAWSPS